MGRRERYDCAVDARARNAHEKEQDERVRRAPDNRKDAQKRESSESGQKEIRRSREYVQGNQDERDPSSFSLQKERQLA